MQLLASYPRVPLLIGPTPLEPLPRLSKLLGGPGIWIKRDDCTPLALGGNKLRKLEYLLGEARSHKADLLITNGGLQSNHARQTAAAAVVANMACDLVLAPCNEISNSANLKSGNLLLDRLLGATIHFKPTEDNLAGDMQEVAQLRREEGFTPYIINAGGSSAIGSLGYISCAAELVKQARANELQIDCVVHATGSCGTQAGLLAGLQLLDSTIDVVGVAVSPDHKQQFRIARVVELLTELQLMLGDKITADKLLVRVNGNHCGPDYGVADSATLEAISLLAETESIILDPVYTGKAMAGLIALIRGGHFSSQSNVIFLHTGGTPALFANTDEGLQSASNHCAAGVGEGT